MSRSLNKVTLIGNVGNDPEIRATASGSPFACGASSAAALFEGLSQSAAARSASRVSASPRPEARAAEGGTSRSTTQTAP